MVIRDLSIFLFTFLLGVGEKADDVVTAKSVRIRNSIPKSSRDAALQVAADSIHYLPLGHAAIDRLATLPGLQAADN